MTRLPPLPGSDPRPSAFVRGPLLLAAALLTGCGGTHAPAPAPAAVTAVAADTTIESAEPWSFNAHDGRLIRTPHYRLFTTQPDTVLSARLPAFLESALAHYRTLVTGPDAPLPEPPLKLETYVLRSRADWALLTRQMTGDAADLFLRIPRGGFAFGGRALLFDVGARDTLAVAAHEGWHQYTQRTFAHRLPTWLEEGLATACEGHRFDARGVPAFLPWCNTERFDALRRAHAAGRLMPLGALLDAAPATLVSAPTADDALTYYAQVWALTLFLLDGPPGHPGKYRPNLEALVRDAATGATGPRLAQVLGRDPSGRTVVSRVGAGVFMAYFGQNVEADPTSGLAAEYARFITALVQPGSREAIVAGRSPFTAPQPPARHPDPSVQP